MEGFVASLLIHFAHFHVNKKIALGKKKNVANVIRQHQLDFPLCCCAFFSCYALPS